MTLEKSPRCITLWVPFCYQCVKKKNTCEWVPEVSSSPSDLKCISFSLLAAKEKWEGD